MGNLSKHFSRHEIECRCGCGFDTIDAETILIAESARVFYDRPITPSSGARCASHNRAVGGEVNSRHLLGRAIDLPVDNPNLLFDYLSAKYPGKYGIGLYKTFVHIDSRVREARWIGFGKDSGKV